MLANAMSSLLMWGVAPFDASLLTIDEGIFEVKAIGDDTRREETISTTGLLIPLHGV